VSLSGKLLRGCCALAITIEQKAHRNYHLRAFDLIIHRLVGRVISQLMLISNDSPSQTVCPALLGVYLCITPLHLSRRMIESTAHFPRDPVFLHVPQTSSYHHRDTGTESRSLRSFKPRITLRCHLRPPVSGRWLVTAADCRGYRTRLIKFACSQGRVFDEISRPPPLRVASMPSLGRYSGELSNQHILGPASEPRTSSLRHVEKVADGPKLLQRIGIGPCSSREHYCWCTNCIACKTLFLNTSRYCAVCNFIRDAGTGTLPTGTAIR
jgi:hypothetical protein